MFSVHISQLTSDHYNNFLFYAFFVLAIFKNRKVIKPREKSFLPSSLLFELKVLRGGWSWRYKLSATDAWGILWNIYDGCKMLSRQTVWFIWGFWSLSFETFEWGGATFCGFSYWAVVFLLSTLVAKIKDFLLNYCWKFEIYCRIKIIDVFRVASIQNLCNFTNV